MHRRHRPSTGCASGSLRQSRLRAPSAGLALTQHPLVYVLITSSKRRTRAIKLQTLRVVCRCGPANWGDGAPCRCRLFLCMTGRTPVPLIWATAPAAGQARERSSVSDCSLAFPQVALRKCDGILHYPRRCMDRLRRPDVSHLQPPDSTSLVLDVLVKQ